MTRTQIQFPDPLYQRLKQVAEANDWSMAEVVRRASELYVQRFPEPSTAPEVWAFPTLELGGDFRVDPADVCIESSLIESRTG